MNQYIKKLLAGLVILCMTCNVLGGCAQKESDTDNTISISVAHNEDIGTEIQNEDTTTTKAYDETVKNDESVMEAEKYVLLEAIDESKSGTGITRTTYEYDESGRILQERSVCESLIDGTESSYTRTYKYDDTGRILQIHMEGDTFGGFESITHTYNYREDGYSIVDDTGAIYCEGIYDKNGRVISDTIYAAGQARYRYEFKYGEDGYYVKYFIEYDNEGEETYRRVYQYDAQGNILAEHFMDIGAILIEIEAIDDTEYTTVYQSTSCMLSSATYYYYDDMGRLTRTETDRMWIGVSSENAGVGNMIESLYAVCTYDENGIGTLTTYNKSGSHYDRADMFINTYDSAGNLLTHETYDSTVTYTWEKIS